MVVVPCPGRLRAVIYGFMATVPFMYIICGLLVGLAVTRYLEEYPSVKDLTFRAQ